MSYKTLLLYLDGRETRAEQLAVAFDLAEGFDAHLVALFAPGPVTIPYALAEAGPMIRELEQRRRAAALEGARSKFEAAAAKRRAVRVEWRSSVDDALPAACLGARYADLVIAAQPRPDAAAALGFASDLVLAAGRPVLFVPYAGSFAAVGRRVLLAWNGGREAARAATDALPFLARAARVDVVAFDAAPADGGNPCTEAAAWLARHGVKATAARQVGINVAVGEQVLSCAADFETDLVVMGGYGRSRLRESILGGATRTMLESMTVPVLMSH